MPRHQVAEKAVQGHRASPAPAEAHARAVQAPDAHPRPPRRCHPARGRDARSTRGRVGGDAAVHRRRGALRRAPRGGIGEWREWSVQQGRGPRLRRRERTVERERWDRPRVHDARAEVPMLVRGLHDRRSGDGRGGGGGGGGPFADACQAGVALADEVATA